eukprot:359247_1
MDQRLLANDYDVIAAKIKTLAQDIQYITRQSDLIGGIDDTPTFRKKLTGKIQSTSKLVMVIKNGIQKANDNGGTDNKWKKLEQQFFNNFERLREVTTSVGTKFKASQPKEAKPSKSRDNARLLDNNRGSNNNNNNNNGYGGTSNGQQRGNEQEQQQEQLFRPYDDLYELENYEEQLYDILQNLQLLYESHKDLNMLIYDQDEIVEQLHDNVEDARENVQAGVTHLDKAAKHQKAYRGKLCIVLGVLLVIAVIVTIVVVLNKKN